MIANNAIRAVVASSAGALFWVLMTSPGFPMTPEVAQHKLEQSVVRVQESPAAFVRQETAERFEPNPAPSAERKPASPSIAERRSHERQAELDRQAAAQKKADQKERERREAEHQRALEKAAKERSKKIAEEKRRKAEEARQKAAKKAADKAKKAAERSLKGVPVKGGVIGAGFGATGSWGRYHTGLDFRASYGTVVRAVAPGRITFAGNKGNWAGNYVVITHSGGKKTLYAHLSSISKHSGRVQSGTKIGRVGQSGRAFGAHLHFELYPSGASPGDVYSAINPRPWLRRLGVRLG